jgi:hypothetical protein
METAPSPETSVTVHWITQRLIPADFNLHHTRDENMKYGISVNVSKPYNRP